MGELLALVLLGGLVWWIAASMRSTDNASDSGRLADDEPVRSADEGEALSGSASKLRVRKRSAMRLRILYADADGIETERVVRVLAARPVDGDVMFDAWCSLRRDERTFRASRVSYAETASDGKPISGLDEYLAEVFRFELWVTPRRTEPEWWSPELSSAYLLVWLAAADGRIDGDQKQVVLDFVRALGVQFSDAHWEPLNYRGRRMSVDERSEMACKVKGGGTRLMESTLEAALRVHAARKLGSGAAEREALGELQRLLS